MILRAARGCKSIAEWWHLAETSGREVISPLEQAILLSLAEQQRRLTAKDELRPWQVAAFSDVVLSQKQTRHLLRRTAKLNRSDTEPAIVGLACKTRQLNLGKHGSYMSVDKLHIL